MTGREAKVVPDLSASTAAGYDPDCADPAILAGASIETGRQIPIEAANTVIQQAFAVGLTLCPDADRTSRGAPRRRPRRP